MRKIALAVAAILAFAGCTSGSREASPDEGEGDNSAGAALIADTVQPLEVREVVHETMKGKRVAFVPILYKGFKIAEQWGAHMQRTFDMLGAEFKVYDSNFDTNQMVRIIDGLIKDKGADVLVLHNPDVGVLTKQIDDAKAAGIYTVVVNMISNQSGDMFVGTDVVSTSRTIAQRAVKDCQARQVKKIAVIDGPGTDGFSIQFNEGIRQIAEENGFEVVATLHSNFQTDQANAAATTIVQRYRDQICAILLPWDVIAIPAAAAVEKAVASGLVAKDAIGIYSVDGSSDGCAAVRDGRIRALSVYDVPGIGTAAASAVQQLLQLGVKPGSRHTVSYVSHVIVDTQNVGKIASACYPGA